MAYAVKRPSSATNNNGGIPAKVAGGSHNAQAKLSHPNQILPRIRLHAEKANSNNVECFMRISI